MPQLRIGALSVGLTIACAGVVFSQEYPYRPIRIVTGGVGGGGDFAARISAQGLTSSLGQQVIVDNRGSGVVPGDTVARAPPDGYTLLVGSGSLWLSPLLQRHVPFDAVKDFAPISATNRAPNILVVHPSLQVNSVKELIALAKVTPGGLSFASTATGGSSHLAGELFKSMAAVNIVRIPYKSGATHMNDLIAGQVQMSFAIPAEALPHIKSGRLKALAVTTLTPSVLAPGLPTVAASGLPGYESGTVTGIFAPAKTPAAIINRLNRESVRIFNVPEARERLLNSGVEPVGSSPKEFADYIRSDVVKWGKVFKDAGIQPE